MKKNLVLLGLVVWFLSGVTLFILQIYWFDQWWGLWGVIASLFLAPLSQIFPLLYWLKEGFPLLYMTIWLFGLLGLFTSIRSVKSTFRQKFGRQHKKVERDFIDLDPED